MVDRNSGLYFELYKYRYEYFRDFCILDGASIGAGTTCTQLYRITKTWVVAKSRTIVPYNTIVIPSVTIVMIS